MSAILGHVGDIGETVCAIIPFERVSTRTYPNQPVIPIEMKEEGMAMRKSTGLKLAYPDAAGIDFGSSSHFVAAALDRDDESVREIKSFTLDPEVAAERLVRCGIDTVAMKSPRVYWIAFYELLDARGLAVYLVNVRHVKNVSGRKSDVLDCQWLQKLMSYGLLFGAFRPADDICALRSVSRQRDVLTGLQAGHIQRMQKALIHMNVQLTSVISNIVGETGQKILRVIIAGEREGRLLVILKNVWIRLSEEEITKSLQGNWREEHLFALKQAIALYDFHAAQLAECDILLDHMLAHLTDNNEQEPERGRQMARSKNAFRFDVPTYLLQLCGVDLARINGINPTTALKVNAEVGADLSRLKTAKLFASWLGLCPGTRISGGKVISDATKRRTSRAAQALRLAAITLHKSQSALGAYFLCMAARLDRAKAITATDHKLACA